MRALISIPLLLFAGCWSVGSHSGALGEPCGSSADCTMPLTCFLDTAGGECSQSCISDLDCGGLVCASGRCRAACQADSDCAHRPGFVCNIGRPNSCGPGPLDAMPPLDGGMIQRGDLGCMPGDGGGAEPAVASCKGMIGGCVEVDVMGAGPFDFVRIELRVVRVLVMALVDDLPRREAREHDHAANFADEAIDGARKVVVRRVVDPHAAENLRVARQRHQERVHGDSGCGNFTHQSEPHHLSASCASGLANARLTPC